MREVTQDEIRRQLVNDEDDDWGGRGGCYFRRFRGRLGGMYAD